MTRLIARLILAMLTLPLAVTVFLLTILPFTSTTGPLKGWNACIIWGVTCAFVFIYWTYIWRDAITWNRTRKFQTAFVMAGACGVGFCGYVFLMAVARGIPPGPAAMISGGLVPTAFVLGTVLIWRETPVERHARLMARGVDVVTCVACGYNMTGLKTTRCPECGAEFTLDQLLAGQSQESLESQS